VMLLCTDPCYCVMPLFSWFSCIGLFFARTDRSRPIDENRDWEPEKTTRGLALPTAGSRGVLVALIKRAQQQLLSLLRQIDRQKFYIAKNKKGSSSSKGR